MGLFLRRSISKPIVLCIIGSGLLSLARFNTIPVGSFFDDAHYIVLAESLSAGRGYRLLNYPHSPIETAFPPGWPLLLAPLVSLFPDNFIPLKMLSLMLWLASIPLAHALFAQRLRPPYPLIASALVASNAVLVGAAGTVMSEAAYLFFSLLTLSLFERWRAHGKLWQSGKLSIILALILSTITIRTVGVTLLAGLLVYALYSMGKRRVLVMVSLLILGSIPLAWFNGQRGGALIFSPLYQSHVEYVASQMGYFARVWQHAPGIPYRTMATALVPMIDFAKMPHRFVPVLDALFNGGVLLAAAGGLVLSLRRPRAMDWYALFYSVLLYVWVVYTDELRVRLLIPLIPMGYFYLVHALQWCIERWTPGHERFVRVGVAGCVGLMLLLNVADNAHDWMHPIRGRVPDLTQGTTWIRHHAPADAVLMTVNPIPDYLYARRQTVGYPYTEHADLETYIQRNRVAYILVRPNLNHWDNVQHELDWYAAEHLLPYVKMHPERFQAVYQEPSHNVAVYQVITQETASKTNAIR